MEIDLQQLSFGKPAAEREVNLAEFFIERESFTRLRNGEKTVALGNRGSGKTAIFKMIAESERKKGTLVIEIAPENYSYELLNDTLSKEMNGNWAKQSAFAAAWKYVIYVLVMKEIAKKGGLQTGSRAKIYSYIRDNHSNSSSNPIGSLISYLKRIEGFKIGKYEASIKSRELQKLFKLEEIDHLLVDLRNILQNLKVVVLVDELDRGWDASEDAKAFVSGLFYAAQSINQECKGLNVLLSLRKELYQSIPSLYDDAQKVRDLIELIEWDENSLLELICKRIQTTLPGTGTHEVNELWQLVFSESIEYRNTKSYNYIVDRTLYRPREMISFCESIRDYAVSKKRSLPLNYDTISESELSYSESRFTDIVAEYRFEYPGLDTLLETFRGMTYNFEREGLEWHCLRIVQGDINVGSATGWCSKQDHQNIIQILWQVGFLRAHAVGGLKANQRSGSKYLGSHQFPNMSLHNVSRFHVHHMFRSYLGMKEGTYTIA